MINETRENLKEVNYLLGFPPDSGIVLKRGGNKKYRLQSDGEPFSTDQWESPERIASRVDGILKLLRLLHKHKMLT